MYKVNQLAKAAPKPPLHVLEARQEQGYRLRVMYRSLGWSRAQCAKFLHVSERTLHNWECGRHEVPYAAYKLLRIHCGMELPGSVWRGWSLSRGKLWTPEGHGLTPKDAAWWSLLALRADLGAKAMRELRVIRALGGAGAMTGATMTHDSDSRAAAALAGGVGVGLVPFKTTPTESPSKIIASYNHTVFCYNFCTKGGRKWNS